MERAHGPFLRVLPIGGPATLCGHAGGPRGPFPAGAATLAQVAPQPPPFPHAAQPRWAAPPFPCVPPMPFAFCSARCGQRFGCRLRAALRYGGTGARWGACVATFGVNPAQPALRVAGPCVGLTPTLRGGAPSISGHSRTVQPMQPNGCGCTCGGKENRRSGRPR